MQSLIPAEPNMPVPCEGFHLIGPLVAEEMLAIAKRVAVRDVVDSIDQSDIIAVAADGE